VKIIKVRIVSFIGPHNLDYWVNPDSFYCNYFLESLMDYADWLTIRF